MDTDGVYQEFNDTGPEALNVVRSTGDAISKYLKLYSSMGLDSKSSSVVSRVYFCPSAKLIPTVIVAHLVRY